MITEHEYISGNNVISPKKVEHNEHDKLNKKQRLERKNRLNRKQKLKNRKSIMSVALVFLCGVMVISRYSTAYSYQKQLASMKAEQKVLTQANDDLKVNILKVSNFKAIEESAASKYNMSEPDAHNIIIADLSKDNFSDVKDADDEKNSEDTIWSKIKQLISKNN